MLQKLRAAIPLTLLLTLFVALIGLLLLRYLHSTYEGFQQQSVADQLAANPSAQQFFDFHGKVCAMWSQVIDAAMKSDQTTLSQEDYVQALEAKQTPPVTFVRCVPALSPSVDLQTLIASVPAVDVYTNTLAFLNTEIQKILDNTEAALQGQANGNANESFADRPPSIQAPFNCQQQPGGLLQCTTQMQSVAPASASADASGANADPAALLQTFLQTIDPVVTALSSLSASLQTAQTGLDKLNDYKQKAESGAIYSEVKLPPGSS
jgi:hypothetical protein